MKNKAMERYDYHFWANKTVLNHLNALPEEVYTKQLESVFPTIESVIKHIYQTDGLWLSVMNEDSFEKTKEKIASLQKEMEGKGIKEMVDLFEGMKCKYHSSFEAAVDPKGKLAIHHPKFGSMNTTMDFLVDHVVNHGTYHRGNISAMIRQQGYEGVQTDLIIYEYQRQLS